MTIVGWLQAALTFALVALCVRPLGNYMYPLLSGLKALQIKAFPVSLKFTSFAAGWSAHGI
jgi:hypothetical protein